MLDLDAETADRVSATLSAPFDRLDDRHVGLATSVSGAVEDALS